MKVSIVGGSGGVGSSLAFNLLRSSVPGYDVVLLGRDRNKVTSHVMDLQDVVGLGRARSVRGGSEEDLIDSDVVAITAGAPNRPGVPRREFLRENAEIVSRVVDPLVDAGWGGVLLLLTVPVDAIATWLVRRGALPRERVIGYTLNDSLRMRLGVARALDVHPGSVEAYVLGEQGASPVPLWERVTVDGRPVALAPAVRAEVEDYISTWRQRHMELESSRSSAWSSGLGGSLMIDAIASGSDEVIPTVAGLDGEYGIRGVALGVPARLGAAGIREIVELPLSPGERSRLEEIAEGIRSLVEEL